MLLTERWAIDPKVLEELDDMRRRVAQQYGETYPPPPPPLVTGAGRALLPRPKYSLNELKEMRVELDPGSGQRRVYLVPGSGSTQLNGTVGGDLELVVCTSRDGSRTVRVKEPATPDKCLVCNAKANKRCPVCKVPYCSAECQLDDWPSHQPSHQPICGNQNGSSQQQTPDDRLASPGARPDEQVGRVQSAEMPGPRKVKLTSPRPIASVATKPLPTSTVKSPDGGAAVGPASPRRALFPVAKQVPVPRPEPPRPVWLEPASLPMGEWVKVTICYGTDLSELFLQQASSVSALSKLQGRLQEVCFTGSAYRPSQGSVCAALFADDGQWYRARVVALHDARCSVYFVDYGNSADVEVAQTCPLPEGCSELPEQAVRCGLYGVRPSGDTGWAEEAILELTMLMQESLTARACRVANSKHEVELQTDGCTSLGEVLVSKGLAKSTLPASDAPAAAPAPAPAASPTARPPPKLPSVLSLTKPGEALELTVTVCKKGKVWVLVVHPEVASQLMEVEEELNEQCPKKAGEVHKLSVGDYVASKSLEDGRWYRACVTDTTPGGHTVRYIDYGNDEANTRVVPLDEKYLRVVAASARLDGKDTTFLPVGVTLAFTVNAGSGDGSVLHGQLVCTDDGKAYGAATLSPWDIGLEEKATPASPVVKKADPVPKPAKPVEKVSLQRSSPQPEAKVLKVPVRPLPANKKEMQAVWMTKDVLFLHEVDKGNELSAMMDDLNAWVAQAPQPPASGLTKGDYVCALFSQDNRWYRGQLVSDLSEEGSFNVLFIDYGNNEVVPAASLRLLPGRFAKQPVFAVCVVPQGVNPTDPRLEAALAEQPFAVVEVSSEHGLPVVRLFRKDGKCINDMLAPLGPRSSSKETQPAKQSTTPTPTVGVPAAKAAPKVPAPTVAAPTVAAPKVVPSKVAAMYSVAECPKPRGRFEAAISYVEGDTVYVLPLDRNDALVRVTRVLESEGKKPAVTLTKLPSPSQCIIALYSLDKLWYRARVLSTDEKAHKVQVQFVDFGNVEAVSGKDLRPLPEELARDPACVLPVRLAGVAHLAPNAMELLPSDELLQVELVDTAASPISVRLVQAGTCINEKAAARAPEPPKEKLANRPFPPGHTPCTVTHISPPDRLFYLQQTSVGPALFTMMEELNASIATAGEATSLKLGDAVCARYAADNLWYRGIVVSPPEDDDAAMRKVLFIDFGNTEDVPKADLKALPEKFEAVPVFANCVILDEVTNVSERCAKQLLNEQVEVEVVGNSFQTPKVRLYVNGACINHLVE